MATAAQLTPAQMQQSNAAIRQGILRNAVRLRQPIFNQAWNAAGQPQLQIYPKFIGLLRSFTVVITGTITNNDGAATATLSDLGIAALLDPAQGIVLTDLNGYNRIQTGLWHLLMIESVKRQKLYGASFTPEQGTPWQTAGAWAPIQQPSATIAHGDNSTFRIQFDVPVTYMPDDLRGGIWISVVNATMQLALNINPQVFTNGTDNTFSVYSGVAVANMALSNVNVSVYQNYYDQLPVGPDGQPALPLLDLSTVYELKKTQFPNIAAGVETPLPFTNTRRYLSTMAVYDSSPGASPNRFAGSDVNYWALQTASQLYLWRLDPQQFAEMFRHLTGWDVPNGFYYFDHRRQPIYTPAYGNMQIVLNPISAGTGAIVHIGYEDFADVNLLTQSTSLPAGN